MKRLFVLLLSGMILASSVPMDSFAASMDAVIDAVPIAIREGEPTSNSQKEPTNQALESAILAVKDKIAIPKEYSEFNYYFYDANYYSDSYWSLSWRNPDTDAYIQVNSDEDNHITYFSKYDYSNKTTGISKFLKKELKATADEFIKKIAPETANKLEYVGADFAGLYNGNYVYNYQRRENGIAFPDNTVSVWVNSISGEVESVSINWLYDETIPSSKVKLTKEEATALLKKNMQMKLVYRSNYYRIYDEKGIASKKAFLVYEPTQSYISVDAKTGEVYLTRSQWVDTGNAYGGDKNETATEDSEAESPSRALTEEEIKKIEELKNLISKAKAIDIITSNKYLYLDKNLVAYSASLNKSEDASGDTNYVWNVSLSDPREIDYKTATDYYRAYAYATVDAETGKILSYYSSVNNFYDEVNQTWEKVTVPYDKEESKGILEKFLKAQINDRFSNSILVSQNDDYIAYYTKAEVPVYGGYRYNYNRVNEGVEYPYNNIYGSVDGVTGKIYSFGSYWDDSIEFESTKGVMTADKAMDYYLSKDGYDLKYEINVINKFDSSYGNNKEYYDYTGAYSVEYDIRLVYRPDIDPIYISPFTGEQLDYSGEVYKETVPYSYLDIKDTEENRNIFLLTDMNIGFEGDNFLPNQAITNGEMKELLEKIGYGYGYTTTEDSKMDDPITREEIAQTFVIKMGLEKVAKLQGIYKTGFADESKIGSEYVGAVALAKGLGLMEADSNNNFNPKSNVTRFEAVNLILNFIAAQQIGIY